MRRKQVLALVAVITVLAAAALVAVFLTRPPGGQDAASPPGQAASADPVLVVKIDNVDEARPATGLGSADVVYVEPVEGGLTRLAAVFSTNRPEGAAA